MSEGLPETLNTPASPTRGPDSVSLIQPLLADQQQRWANGDRVLVETYIKGQPTLRADANGMMGLIANEVVLRQKHGEAAPVDEYRRRFPELASELVRYFADKTDVAENLPGTLHHDQQTPASRARVAGSAAAPEAVPGYEIQRVLGRGGMGVVYKAWQKGLNRTVALKMILAGVHAGTEDITRFRIEAEAAARLQHPNITQIYEVGETQGRPFFAMEYVEGCSLADKLDGVPQPPRVAAELVELLARAMHHAHERGIVHRDLKPANILLTNAAPGAPNAVKDLGQPKITDFGLAKRLDADLRQTQTGAVLGTPSYMSPEQAAGKISDIGPATDVYALGAILYDMLTGRPPFKSNSLFDTLHQVQAMEPVSPTHLEPNVPRDLETICLKCLRKEGSRRYTRAIDLAEDLHHFLTNEPISARPTPAWERVVKWSRRRPAAAALVVVSIVSAISLLAGGIWSYAKISASLTREERQHQQADASFRDALGAVDQMLLQVGAVDLADVPQMEPVRKKLLTEALGFMQKFLSERGDDTSVRHEAARAYLFEGDVQDMLGNTASAEQAYGDAISQFTALTEASPQDTTAKRNLARSYNDLGVLLKKVNRFQDAEAALRKGLALRQELLDSAPGEPSYKRELAGNEYSLGTVLAILTGKQKEAEQSYQKALALQGEVASLSPDDQRAQARTLTNLGNLLRATDPPRAEKAFLQAKGVYSQLAEKHPTVSTYRRELARSHHNLAVVFRLSSKYSEAEKEFAESFRLLEDLINDFPHVPEYRKEAAILHRSKGDYFLMRAANVPADEKIYLPKAEQEYRQALALLDRLVATVPGVPTYRRELALLYPSLGRVLERTKRSDEARKTFDQALAIQQKLVKDYPEVTEYHGDLAITQYLLGQMLYFRNKPEAHREAVARAKEAIREHSLAWNNNRQNVQYRNELFLDFKLLIRTDLELRENADAATAAADLVQVFGDDSYAYRLAAECLARCAEHAHARNEQDLVQKYGAKAVEYLRVAVEKGFKDAAQLRQSPSFDAVRQRDDFKKLLHDIERVGGVGVG